MSEIVLLPFGDQGHIDALLIELAGHVTAGKEEEFCLLLPTRHLLDAYRRRLVPVASRRLNLLTFDDLVAAALAAVNARAADVAPQMAAEITLNILKQRAADLPILGNWVSREMAAEIYHALTQLRRAKLTAAEITATGEQVLADLALVWAEYEEFLATNGLADIAKRYSQAAGSLAAVPWLQKVEQLHLCWFFDFNPLQLAILQALLAIVPKVTLWLAYEHDAHAAYLESTISSLKEIGFSRESRRQGKTSPLAANLFLRPARPASAPAVKGLAAPRVRQELELVAREIKALATTGVKASDIALIVPDPSKYLPSLRRYYQQCGIEISAPMLTRLESVPWLKECLNLWRAAARGWDREGFRPLADSVYLTEHLPAGFDGRLLKTVLAGLKGDCRQEQWLSKLGRECSRLSQQLTAASEPAGQGEINQILRRCKLAANGIRAWLDLGSPLAGQRSREEHCQLFMAIVEANPKICPAEDSIVAVRDRAAYHRLGPLLAEYLDCSRLLRRSQPIGPGQFVDELGPWLKQDFVITHGGPDDVLVLTPAQARGLRLPWVFILGLNHGVFPAAAREHWLLSRLPCPGADTGTADLARQRIFFHSAVAAAGKGLYISRQLPGIDDGAEISSFWREIEGVVPALPVKSLASSDLVPTPEQAVTAAGLAQGLAYGLAWGQKFSDTELAWFRGRKQHSKLLDASAVIQRRQGPLPADSYDGALAASSVYLEQRFGGAVYSISRLEQYVRCPFAFFARYCLQAQPVLGEQAEYSSVEQGNLLHWLLERFYKSGLIAEAVSGQEESILTPLIAFAREWLTDEGYNPAELLWQLRAKQAAAMAAALIEADLTWLKRTGLTPVLFEASFGLPGSDTGLVTLGGGVYFQGKIDRIDILKQADETWAVVYDYKTARPVTRSRILSGKSLQIPVYLLAAEPLLKNLGYAARVMGGGYYIIREARLAGGVWQKQFSQFAKSNLGSLDEAELTNLLQTVGAAAKEYHAGILAGDFSPNPDGDVCRWCDYARCCRYDKHRFRLKGGGRDEAER